MIKKLIAINLSWILFVSTLFYVVFSFISVTTQTSATGVTTTELVIKPACILSLIVYPEKRIPRSGNWRNQNLIEVYNTENNTKIQEIAVQANAQGLMSIDVCQQLTLEQGDYDLFVAGFSHLRKKFASVTFDERSKLLGINLSEDGDELFAGETSPVFDNKINSLDISTQIRNMFENNNIKNDLNRDGKVNTLDISNTIYNFYLTGD